MRVSDKAIVLQSIKHGDKKYILKLYTRQHGLVTVMAQAGKSHGAKVRSGNILPLSLIEAELILKQNKEIHQLREASGYFALSNISTSLSKLSIAQFLNEILIKALREQGPNPDLFEFIETCLKFLNDTQEDYVNLHLYFLSELTKYLGFEPQNNYSRTNCFFDCREGSFSAVSLTFPLGLSQEESHLFSEFLKINSLRTKISNSQRQVLLDILIAYYRLHIPGFNEVKSLSVLREVIAGS
jgi:DNA repair protein RecO (recombination protein O)